VAAGRWGARILWNKTRVHLGSYNTHKEAARAYDKAALCKDGAAALLNFPTEDYKEYIQHWAGRPWAEVAESRVAHDFTAQSNISTFRGVYRAPASDKWSARISWQDAQFCLGAYDTEEEAALAYDREALKKDGPAALLNFVNGHYVKGTRYVAGGPWTEVVTALRREAFFSSPRMWTSQFRGVYKISHSDKWGASMQWQSKRVSLGRYYCEVEAAAAYDEAAFIRLGSAAQLNLPSKDYAKETHQLAGLPWEEVVAATLRREARASTLRQQGRNFRGVYKGRAGKWRACIGHQGTEYSLGLYASEEEAAAAAAYDKAAFIKFGPAARLNFPSTDYARETQHLAGQSNRSRDGHRSIPPCCRMLSLQYLFG